MAEANRARFEYRGFEVFTGLLKFDALGWTARYSIYFAEQGSREGQIAHGGEIRVSSNHVDAALAAARSAARLWIDLWVTKNHG